MTNNGQLQLSSGTTDFYGSLTGTSGSKVIVSGGGTATFYNPLAMQSGSEFRVSTASTAVFFGMVNGINFFTGSGTKDFEGGSSALGPVITEGSTVVQPSATVNADNFRENALTVSGNVNITPDGTSAGTSKLVTLTINPGGKLDLSNNHLIVTSGSVGSWTGADYTGITGAIKSGRNNGAWNGSGIVTSQPLAISQITTLAVAAASDVNKTTFAGQPVNPSDVLVMYTYTGDANLDGKVNADDYFQIDSHINKFANSAKSWFNGDFNYDGQINGDDYFLIDNAYAGQGAPFSSGSLPGGVSSVPEPAATLSALVATAAIFTRRQRRC
jgi:hypothetical protein